jgi:glutamate synthase domain-containing protein 1
MCGIVGLLIKNRQMRGSLGEFLTPMMICMGDRGPDSAGLAIYGDTSETNDSRRFSLLSTGTEMNWQQLAADLERALNTPVEIKCASNHALLTTVCPSTTLKDWLKVNYADVYLLSTGTKIELYKDAGHPSDLARRYNFRNIEGTHCVGHTRMATESAVTPVHAHPYTAGEDFCLVHNGAFSNPYSLRSMLERRGIHFETDNDTEAACRFLEWRMREGDNLEDALKKAILELDGFYTLLMATADKIVLVRDAFACKPAVVAETEDYVAISSEFRALAHLPGIQNAHIFEPDPEEIYSWSV